MIPHDGNSILPSKDYLEISSKPSQYPSFVAGPHIQRRAKQECSKDTPLLCLGYGNKPPENTWVKLQSCKIAARILSVAESTIPKDGDEEGDHGFMRLSPISVQVLKNKLEARVAVDEVEPKVHDEKKATLPALTKPTDIVKLATDFDISQSHQVNENLASSNMRKPPGNTFWDPNFVKISSEAIIRGAKAWKSDDLVTANTAFNSRTPRPLCPEEIPVSSSKDFIPAAVLSYKSDIDSVAVADASPDTITTSPSLPMKLDIEENKLAPTDTPADTPAREEHPPPPPMFGPLGKHPRTLHRGAAHKMLTDSSEVSNHVNEVQ